jgi:hypothetical protein
VKCGRGTPGHCLTLLMIDEHLGMCRSAAVELKLRPQVGHWTNDGSGADACIGGRSAPDLPAAMAAL